MSNVSAFAPIVNPSTDDACRWLEKKADSGEVSGSASRLAACAVNAMTSVLREDEPHDLDYALSNLQDLADRWQNLNPDKKGDTARAYIARARWALENYRQWLANPSSFRFKKRDKSPLDRSGKKTKPAQPRVQLDQSLSTVASPQVKGTLPRTFPLGGDRGDFSFELPLSGLNVRDVMKVACHLMTLCEDFDPTAPNQTQFFAIAKRES